MIDGVNKKVANTTVVVIEPHLSGHHGVYLEWIISALAESGVNVFLATSEESASHPVVLALQGKLKGFLTVMPVRWSVVNGIKVKGLFSAFIKSVAVWTLYRSIYRRIRKTTKPDIVFLPYLDELAISVAFRGAPFGATKWSAIAMQPQFHYPEIGIVKEGSRGLLFQGWIYRRILAEKNLTKLVIIDETLTPYLSKHFPELVDRVLYMPDPIEIPKVMNKKKAKTMLGLTVGRPVILVYGSITKRKGVDTLLAAMSIEEFPKEVDVLIAGAQDQYVKSLLGMPLGRALIESGRVYQINHRLSKEEEALVFSAASYVWAGYKKYLRMSGIIVLAGRMKLPIIACDSGLVGWLTKKYASGILVDVMSEKSVSEGVKRLVSESSDVESYVENGYLAYQRHSVKHAISVLRVALNVDS